MEVVAIVLLAVLIFLFYYVYQQRKKIEDLKRQAIFLSKKDLQFLEFAIDMYIKYAIELNIASKEQHEFIVSELERLRKEIEEKMKTLN